MYLSKSRMRGRTTTKQLLLIMQLTGLLLTICCLTATAKVTSQITLKAENAPLKEVFNQIHQQSGYDIFYNGELVRAAGKVTVTLNSVTLEQALAACLEGKDLTYQITDRTVIIKRKLSVDLNPRKSHTPPIDIKGRVVDEQGQPVIASVVIKGTNRGTTTNEMGEFSLKAVDDNAIIVFSGVGIELLEVAINGKATFDITVKTLVKSLDETVIKGYYSTTRRINTGDVSKVSAETISMQPISNPLAAIEGRMPGVLITQQSGVPGSGFNIQIQGQNSLRNTIYDNGNLPLFVIDGVPISSTSLSSLTLSLGITRGGNALSGINPADIQSIEILKDADATAIYGSRGANGVILITTKKGKAGATKVDLNVYTGIGKVAKTMDMLNTPQYLQMRHEAFINDGQSPNPDIDHDLTSWDTSRYTDWPKVLIGGTAHIFDFQGSVSGGSANTQFFVGAGYHRETTVFPANYSDEKPSVHFSLTHFSDNRRFSLTLSTSYLLDNNRLPGFDITNQAFLLPPDAPELYGPDGKLNWENATFENPMVNFFTRYRSKTNNMISNAVLSYNIYSNLVFKTSVGYTKSTVDEIQANPLTSFNPNYGYTMNDVYTLFANNSIETWIAEPQLDWNKSFGVHKLSLLMGSTFQQSITDGQSVYAYGFTNDQLIENVKAAANVFVMDANYIKYKYTAGYSRIGYNWKDKVILNLTGRRDGSSRFGTGRRFANFGSVGAAWIFSEENFVKRGVKFLSYGKLRSSYGTAGNDRIADYGYLDTYSPNNPYQGRVGLIPTRLFNADYGWESNKKFDIGLELGFFKDRILFTSTFYRNRSSNQLVGYPLALTTGFSSIQFNLPAIVQNTGFEFNLEAAVLKKKSLDWHLRFNLTAPASKLIDYPNIENSNYANTYVVGKSLTTVKTYHVTGVDPQTGVFVFQDIDKDGSISSPNDLQPLKQVAPHYYGGIENSIRYKEWQLVIFTQFVNQTGRNFWYASPVPPGSMFNQPAFVQERWRAPGDETAIQKYTQDPGSSAYSAWNQMRLTGDNTIGNASFIRLRNVFVAYYFSGKWMQKLRLSNCRLFLQGQNILTKTNYKGLDPENQSISILPPLKIFTAGFGLTF
jgi:TonB-dependent starch-binding outer membrane protein SusC